MKLNTLDNIIDTLEQAMKNQDSDRAKIMVIASKHAIQAHALKFAMSNMELKAHAESKRIQNLS